ncbi:SLC13 family permease [Salimicrobium humidisoli]|uniref:Sodium-dependent dicarboxylate transporter SdcS n=1 Tax=Salimicrobium humidisoli TaxID=2029857 RepID=A0ABX4HQE8_9BACI|nr:DASS family sodium-coupled anion symporter [Salimicrobium humidisoli]PBB05102.1 anion transporter [Salimicrobium humidisoli]
MISATWNWLWEKHDQAKELLNFFVKPNNSGTSTGKATDSERSVRPDDDNGGPSYSKVQWIGLITGPLLFVLTLLFFQPEGMSDDAQAVLASTLWVASWWMTEAAPIPLTSLLPIILFPLTGGLGMDETASSYGDDTIFLFMGGFMIALAMEKWNLHKRIALSIILVIGTNTERIILGFMVATGFLSMWISNTATAMMMVPIGLAIIYQVSEQLKDDDSIDTSKENFGFGKALMLGIAYSASIGGVSTLIGTPPNTAFAAIAGDLYGVEISFARWMLFGVPVAWAFLFIAWFYLIKVAYPLKLKTLPGGRDVIKKEKDAIGRAGFEEKVILVVFVLAAFSWITRSFLLQEFVNENINDAVIALTASVILFIIPAKNEKGGRILDWDTAVKLPWGILLLFGGGLAIAGGFSASGLSEWLGNQLTILEGVNLFVVLLAVTVMVIFLTEITSNTATANMMYPIMASLAVALGVHPYAVMIAAGVASSSAFMLPVATPPNAVVFGSGYLRIPDMAKAGIALNFVGVIIVTLAVYFWLPVAWGIDLTEVPQMLKNPN